MEALACPLCSETGLSASGLLELQLPSYFAADMTHLHLSGSFKFSFSFKRSLTQAGLKLQIFQLKRFDLRLFNRLRLKLQIP